MTSAIFSPDTDPKRTAAQPATYAVESVAEAYLLLLKARGIDYFYVGAGTDTAPIVEAYARAQLSGLQFPQPIVAAHENLAVGMAHGYYMISGRPQAVMLHTSVGTANAVCGVINAAHSQVPMLFTAGRTPLFEQGRPGARDIEIHWAQEMFDQAGMTRELVKWDYELRDGLHVEAVVDRALAVAMTAPRGPVYLTLPREVLAAPMRDFSVHPRSALPAAPAADPDSVAALAAAIAAASHPVIMCTASGADTDTVPALIGLCERFGIAVGEARPRYVNFPSNHPLHLGYDRAAIFAAADLLVFLESDVPWIPGEASPHSEAFVAHVGTDPIFAQYPIRSHRSDLTITSTAKALISALAAALEPQCDQPGIDQRKRRLLSTAAALRQAVVDRAARDRALRGPITKSFLSRCIDAVRPANAILVNEYSAVRECLSFDEPGSYFLHPACSGLGWGFPAALGARQAAPGRPVIAVLGDGAYLFANPAVCHQAAAMLELPVIAVIFNNGGWEAVHKSTVGMYPRAHAAEFAEQHRMGPLCSLAPQPDFEKYAEASGGAGIRVSDRAELIPALERALQIAATERRQVLVNVLGQG